MSAAVNMRTCKTRAEHGGPYGNNFRLFAAIRNPSFDEVKRHQSRAETQTAPTGRSAHESQTHVYYPYILDILIPLEIFQ